MVVSWARKTETDPISPTGKEAPATWSATESVCRWPQLRLGVFHAPRIQDPLQTSVASDGIWIHSKHSPLHRAIRISTTNRRISNGGKMRNECGGIKGNQMSTYGCSSRGTVSRLIHAAPSLKRTVAWNLIVSPILVRKREIPLVSLQFRNTETSPCRGRFWLFPLHYSGIHGIRAQCRSYYPTQKAAILS